MTTKVDFVAMKCEDGMHRLCLSFTDYASRYSVFLDVPEDVQEGVALADQWFKGILEGFAAVERMRKDAAHLKPVKSKAAKR